MFRGTLTAALITLLVAPAGMAGKAATNPLRIAVPWNRAALISGGDALVAVDFAQGVDPAAIRVQLGSRDITGEFALRPNGRFEGLVGDLQPGASTLTAKLPDGRGAEITIDDHPSGEPAFSGPLDQPWQCDPGAGDGQCNT